MPSGRARLLSFHSLDDLLREGSSKNQNPTEPAPNSHHITPFHETQQQSPHITSNRQSQAPSPNISNLPHSDTSPPASTQTPIFPPPLRNMPRGQNNLPSLRLFTPASPMATTSTTLPAIRPPATHDIGSCAPCALSLLLTELLTQEVITESSHFNLYKPPLQIFLDHFRLYYDQPPDLTLSTIKKLLINCNCDSIQWMLSPIFRLMLISILHATKQPSTDRFFLDDSLYSSPLWPKDIHDLVSEASIKESIKIMQTANQHDQPPNPCPLHHAAHHGSHFSQEDLLTLTKFLHLKTIIHHECTAANHMHDLRSAALSQCQQRLDQQAHYFTNTYLSYATIHIHHETFILERSTGIQGHFDLVAFDPILQLRYSQISPYAKPSLDTTRSLTQIAHHSPAMLFQELKTLFPEQSVIFSLLETPAKPTHLLPASPEEHTSSLGLNTSKTSQTPVNKTTFTTPSPLATHALDKNSTIDQTSTPEASYQTHLLSLQSLMANTRRHLSYCTGPHLPRIDETPDEDDDLVTITFNHG